MSYISSLCKCLESTLFLLCHNVGITAPSPLLLLSGIWNKEWQSWTWQPDVSQAEREEKLGLWAALHHRTHTRGQTCVCKHTRSHALRYFGCWTIPHFSFTPFPLDQAFVGQRGFVSCLSISPSFLLYQSSASSLESIQCPGSFHVIQTKGREKGCWKINSPPAARLHYSAFFLFIYLFFFKQKKIIYRQTDRQQRASLSQWCCSATKSALLLGNNSSKTGSLI